MEFSGNVVALQWLLCVWLFSTPWTTAHQSSQSFTISQSVLKLMSIESVMLSRHLIFCCPLLLLPSILPSIKVFSNESGGQSTGVAASVSVLSMNIQSWFPLGLSGLSPCCARDSQESSPAPQFESIISSALSLLYGSTLTSIHDYWKNRNFD